MIRVESSRVAARCIVLIVILMSLAIAPGVPSAVAGPGDDAVACAVYQKDEIAKILAETVQRDEPTNDPCQTLIDNGLLTAEIIANLIVEKIDEQTGECSSASLDPTCRGYESESFPVGIPMMMVIVYADPVEEAPYYNAATCTLSVKAMEAEATRGETDPYIHEWAFAELWHDCPSNAIVSLYQEIDLRDGGDRAYETTGPTTTDTYISTYAYQNVLLGSTIGTRGLHNININRYAQIQNPGYGSYDCTERVTIQYPLAPVVQQPLACIFR